MLRANTRLLWRNSQRDGKHVISFDGKAIQTLQRQRDAQKANSPEVASDPLTKFPHAGHRLPCRVQRRSPPQNASRTRVHPNQAARWPRHEPCSVAGLVSIQDWPPMRQPSCRRLSGDQLDCVLYTDSRHRPFSEVTSNYLPTWALQPPRPNHALRRQEYAWQDRNTQVHPFKLWPRRLHCRALAERVP